ncbi:hypothetical protein ACQRBH_10995 [Bariatricus sp. SGI.161]|uniref:hypothetical protein n=1 Tax=Bariatricus sp. SGI.161 TaxID=3420550 RepID=UPI003D01B86D
MRKRIISLLVMLTLICSMSMSVSAVEVPDLTRKGSITVTMHVKKDNKDVIVPGGTLTLYRVGEIYEDDGNYSFIPTGDFADCGETFEDIQSPELASRLAEYAKKNVKDKGETKKVSDKGVVTFKDWELGLYLLVQYEAAEGYNKANPFLVGLPDVEGGKYIYKVDASPKVNIIGQDSGKKTPPKTTSKLPQTGQLNWPIPLLVVSGMVLFAIGWVLCFGRKKSDDET